MIIDATSLTDAQACARLPDLKRDWNPHKWQPKALFVHCARNALHDLTTREITRTPEEIAEKYKTRLLELAADPGMEMSGRGPYYLAKDYCAMIDTIVRSEFRGLQPRVPKLHNVPMADISEHCRWRFTARQDDLGNLHRWVFWDTFTSNRLTAEMHSWHCFGDIAVARAPMMLHIILVGRQVDGRQESSWARGMKNPHFPTGKVRFKKKLGVLSDTHEKMYLSDMPNKSTDQWVDEMWQDGEAQRLTQRIRITVPPEAVCEDTKRQIGIAAEKMRMAAGEQKPYYERPMSRGACDGLSPCPFQYLCHRESPALDISTLGIYTRKIGIGSLG